MKLLLDTHTFMWPDSDQAQLSPAALAACQDPANTVVLSVVSAWEIQIKVQLKKLAFTTPLAAAVAKHQQTYGLQVLPITLDHVAALDGLPTPHKDPFDRMLAAQAIVEVATLVTADPIFNQYPVTVLW
jgi:PIN domain nuclease of toxin-antitoxin system